MAEFSTFLSRVTQLDDPRVYVGGAILTRLNAYIAANTTHKDFREFVMSTLGICATVIPFDGLYLYTDNQEETIS